MNAFHLSARPGRNEGHFVEVDPMGLLRVSRQQLRKESGAHPMQKVERQRG